MRKSSVTSRSSFPSGASSCQTTSSGFCAAVLAQILAHARRAGAEQVLEEVLVALAGGAEQVRAPDEHVARQVLRVVRVLAGHLQRAGLQLLDHIVLRLHAAACGRLRPPQRIGLQLRRRRQPAHALGADVVVDQALSQCTRSGRRVGDRISLDLERLVAPLVGMRIEERGRVHLPRRAVPVEREGERRPAGLRPQLLLPDIVRPAAAGLADAAAHHQHVDDAAVVHVRCGTSGSSPAPMMTIDLPLVFSALSANSRATVIDLLGAARR